MDVTRGTAVGCRGGGRVWVAVGFSGGVGVGVGEGGGSWGIGEALQPQEQKT